LNLFLDGLVHTYGPVEISACSGFTRVARNRGRKAPKR